MFFDFGKILIFLGLVLILLGAFFLLGREIPFLGKLPGDTHIQKKNFGFYFPLTTCILLSLLLSFLLYFISKR